MRQIIRVFALLIALTAPVAAQVVFPTTLPAKALAGTQVGLSIASATTLTIPTGANLAIIQAQGSNNSSGACLFWRDDGTNPTGTAGQQMSAGQSMAYKVTSLPIALIAATGATCTATISYYAW